MSKVLVGLTGSIACFKVAGLISDLVKEGHEVRTIATASALKFIGKSTLEGLSGCSVNADLFADGENMEHIHLGRWADLFLIAPCTANTMAKIKIGLADDLLTTTALAFEKDKPVFIAPAMNKEMWTNTTAQESYAALKKRGFRFIDPEVGDLACGENGEGRLADPEKIKTVIFPNSGKRILVTGGGTREPIDGVRFIGNSSTGKTSQKITNELSAMGFAVKLLDAQTSFKKFEASLKKELQSTHYDAIIHAAAVSDYSVSKVISADYEGAPNTNLKLKTDKSLSLELKPNQKLINQTRDWSLNPSIQIVGFKLTNTDAEKDRALAVQKLFDESPADYIVHNDLTEISSSTHPFRIMSNDRLLASVDGAKKLTTKLSEILGGSL